MHLFCCFASDSPRKQVQQEEPRGVTLHPSFKRPQILPLVGLWPLIPPFPTMSICLAGLCANLPVPASGVVTVRAVPYLLRLGQVPQNKVDAADVKADFGRGVLDGCEGIQGCLPLLPICRAHPFFPLPDHLHQGHGCVVGLTPLLVLPCGAARPLSSSLLLVLLPSPLPVLQIWQEVASLASVKRGPGMGKWGRGCLRHSRFPRRAATGCTQGPLQQPLLTSLGFASRGFS